LTHLTEEQERAIARRDGSLLLAAGAGSGKTSVLVERFVRAVLEDGVAPGRILAITFTERAAGELRERVRARLLELDARETAREAQGANVCTFHSFCARLLRAHPLQAGVEPGFEILEEDFAGRLAALAFRDALSGLLDGERADAVDLVASYGADPLCSMVLDAHAQLRSQGQGEPRLPAVRSEDGNEDAVGACVLIGELLERFGVAYAQRKRARGALDFDDLELDARRLLERRTDVREAWSERFELLMVDEFQDTNPRQLEVLAALDRDNLFTVGDQLQSIYSFRHADVSLFRERHARLAEREASLALTRNFRSRAPILTAVERIFAERMGERFTPLVAGRIEDGAGVEGAGVDGAPSETRAAGCANEEPLVELLLTDKRGWERTLLDGGALAGLPEATPWRQAEARLLAGRVAELVAGGQARAGEVVVLLRSLGDLPVYEAALRGEGLRTLAGVGGFWGHQQVGDLLAWLRALANPLDELALYSTLASPLVGISSDGLALIARAAQERRGGVWQTIEQAFGEQVAECGVDLREALPAADRERMGVFCGLFAAERAIAALYSISELLRRAIAATGYEAHVRSLGWGERRLANVHKLLRLARRFEAREGRDLRGFLDHVAHVELGREADAPIGDGELDAVRLMSIHAAKGLEFPVVCVVDLGREPNLRTPDLLVDGAAGRVGLRLRRLGDPNPMEALDYDELCRQRRDAQEEEEDRVLYVACTRAEDRLLLSGAVAFTRWPAAKPGVAPIVWLAPALISDAPKLAASEQPLDGALTVDTGEGLLVRCVLNAPGEVQEAPPRDTAMPSVEEPQRQPAPALTGRGRAMLAPLVDPDSTMSYTSLHALERCGYRYYVESVLGLPENHAAARVDESGRDDGGIEARARGTIVHALLESIDFTRPQLPSPRDVGLVARRIGVGIGLAAREEIAALIAAALGAEPARRLQMPGRVHREHPFAFSLAPTHPDEPPATGVPLVTGVLDLIVEQPDGAGLIVDYKSDRLAGGEDLEALVRRDYGLQRLLYALAGIENGAHEVEVAHWFLERPGEWVTARFVSSERDHLRERLLELVVTLRARGFVVTDSPHRGLCLTCPARGGLCSWGETRTMSAQSPALEFDVGRSTLSF
jgi:ATP-dependent helicase/nuclease subunit A